MADFKLPKRDVSHGKYMAEKGYGWGSDNPTPEQQTNRKRQKAAYEFERAKRGYGVPPEQVTPAMLAERERLRYAKQLKRLAAGPGPVGGKRRADDRMAKRARVGAFKSPALRTLEQQAARAADNQRRLDNAEIKRELHELDKSLVCRDGKIVEREDVPLRSLSQEQRVDELAARAAYRAAQRRVARRFLRGRRAATKRPRAEPAPKRDTLPPARKNVSLRGMSPKQRLAELAARCKDRAERKVRK